VITFDDGTRIRGKCILVATGVEYRRLDVPRLSGSEALVSTTPRRNRNDTGVGNQDIVIVGAGIRLGRHRRPVAIRAARARHRTTARSGQEHVRYPSYRVEHIDNVLIHGGAVVTACEGDSHLQASASAKMLAERRASTRPALFLFVGAIRTPNG